MKDRFKFRVWDKKSSIFIKNGAIDINLGVFSTSNLLDVPRFVIEQCTGLKDKNGKLIYENDYIKIKGTVYKVFWNKTKISLDNILKKDIIDIDITQNMEVVGNVHEARDSKKV